MSRQPAPSARSGRSPIIYVVALVVIAALVAGGYGVWYLFLRPAGPAAVADATLPPVPGATTGETAIPIGPGGVDGTWNVDTSIGTFTDVSDTSGNFVGYRVQEQLAGIGANTAVGRTPKVTGSLTIAGTKVTAVDITADMTALQSDDSQRDNQLRNNGIQFSQFPTATFKLTTPIDLGSIPADGKEISATASRPADAPRRDEGRADRPQGETVRLDDRRERFAADRLRRLLDREAELLQGPLDRRPRHDGAPAVLHPHVGFRGPAPPTYLDIWRFMTDYPSV